MSATKLSAKFPNRAGDRPDNDQVLRNELKAAGIPTMQEAAGMQSDFLADQLKKQSGEVVTSVLGELHGWTFKRAWYYWVAEGPGIDVKNAMKLHKRFGSEVRVKGDAGCMDPLQAYNGLGCGYYHVDTPEGLKALADTLKKIVKKSAKKGAKANDPS
ncbi:hypothetical protein D3C87_465810 [compost metagenome]